MTGKKIAGWGLAAAALAVGLTAAAAGAASEKKTPKALLLAGGQARLGIEISDVTADKAKELKLPGEYGALVEDVEPDSPAAQAGIQKGDVILRFADERVRSVAHLRRLVRETPAGRKVTVEVSRGGKSQTLEVVPAAGAAMWEMPEMEMAPMAPPAPPAIRIPEFNFDFRAFGFGPRLGISADELTPQLADYFGVKQGKGVLVREVLAGSAAEKAGVKAGDVIIRVDDEEIGDVGDLRQALRREREGKEVSLTLVRDRREMTLKVTLEEPAPRGVRHTAEAWAAPEVEVLVPDEQELRALRQELRQHEQELRRELDSTAYREQMKQLEKEMKELDKQLRQQEKELRENLEELAGTVREQV